MILSLQATFGCSKTSVQIKTADGETCWISQDLQLVTMSSYCSIVCCTVHSQHKLVLRNSCSLKKFRSLFKIIKQFLLLRLVNTLKTVAHVWPSVPQLHSMTPTCCKWHTILTTVWLLETSVCCGAQVSSIIGKCGVRYLWNYAVQQMMPPLCGDTVKHEILNTGMVE